MNTNVIFALLLALILISCSDESPVCTEKAYGEAFPILAGESYCFEDDTELNVVSLNNEFCPCNMQCFWEGQMTINMEWAMSDGTVIEYLHNTAEQIENEVLPGGIVVSSQEDAFSLEEDCSDANPSPAIVEATITVSK